MVDFSFITQETVDQLVFGVLTTLKISGLSGFFAILLGLLLTFIRLLGSANFKKAGNAYVELFRNTPLLIQLYLYYRGLQSVGITLSADVCGVLALSLYTAAYFSEIFRAGIVSLPKQQLEGSIALGLTRLQSFQHVLLPQALRIILPPVGNQLISLSKNSSLVALITVHDLFYVLYKGAVDEFRPLEYFLIGAACYSIISLFIAATVGAVGRALFPNQSLGAPVNVFARWSGA